MIFADTLILSDLHLGSEVSRASDAVRMLKAASFNRLILLGDIFSDLNFRRLKKSIGSFSDTFANFPIQSAKSKSCGSKAITITVFRM